jgi:hypothetical protein
MDFELAVEPVIRTAGGRAQVDIAVACSLPDRLNARRASSGKRTSWSKLRSPARANSSIKGLSLVGGEINGRKSTAHGCAFGGALSSSRRSPVL